MIEDSGRLTSIVSMSVYMFMRIYINSLEAS